MSTYSVPGRDREEAKHNQDQRKALWQCQSVKPFAGKRSTSTQTDQFVWGRMGPCWAARVARGPFLCDTHKGGGGRAVSGGKFFGTPAYFFGCPVYSWRNHSPWDTQRIHHEIFWDTHWQRTQENFFIRTSINTWANSGGNLLHHSEKRNFPLPKFAPALTDARCVHTTTKKEGIVARSNNVNDASECAHESAHANNYSPARIQTRPELQRQNAGKLKGLKCSVWGRCATFPPPAAMGLSDGSRMKTRWQAGNGPLKPSFASRGSLCVSTCSPVKKHEK